MEVHLTDEVTQPDVKLLKAHKGVLDATIRSTVIEALGVICLASAAWLSWQVYRYGGAN